MNSYIRNYKALPATWYVAWVLDIGHSAINKATEIRYKQMHVAVSGMASNMHLMKYPVVSLYDHLLGQYNQMNGRDIIWWV